MIKARLPPGTPGPGSARRAYAQARERARTRARARARRGQKVPPCAGGLEGAEALPDRRVRVCEEVQAAVVQRAEL